MSRSLLVVAALLASAAMPVQAENSRPQPIPYPTPIAAPRDVPYPGVIKLDIDATDTRRGIFTVRETIPVAHSGDTVLLMPQWLPGNHSPSGQLDKLASLHIRANGKELAWIRDPVQVYAWHVDVPAGAKQLDVELQFISATDSSQGSVVMSPSILRLQWNSMSLYPAGYFTRQIQVDARVKYPDGWTAYAGLPSKKVGDAYVYERTDYDTLVDSPTMAGRYAKQWQLSPRVFLDVVADTPDQLDAKPEQIEAHKRLVDQAVKNFGAQHYDNYHFLLHISSVMGGIGLEHHRSSEDGSRPGYFTDWDQTVPARNLLPHEYTHSWDGKFRRGADLWTPSFNVPMRDSLLWVYEGQTQFWGYVLQARSGLVSKQDTLDQYAMIMASYDNTPGRQWRPLVDTTNDPIISQRRPKGWTSWQRSEDYYNEGLLVWMEVDSILRKQSGGAKSIDDFARAFFGINDGDWGVVTYNFDDVAATLNRIQPYDWAGFLRKRVTETSDHAPLQGFVDNGYKLVYTDKPSAVMKQDMKARKTANFNYSLGLSIGEEGKLTAVIWDSPAFKAGLTVGGKLLAVNGITYSEDVLTRILTEARTGREPIRLLVSRNGQFETVAIDYHGGPRYPHLEKIGTGEGGLDRLLTAR
ncbi:M61 family metallopeptidase [Sphingomonas quercus]|uniref:Peptidase M61 n=1 Tax=Sphingomonas quercus TaxID=2842451 RepID=A0ABS6BIC5_9SPHN|nr:peptidase M61 [Sphingomonas quercus]MBU3078060.1 peptidase M61 [Sphingomonas quercus]